MVAPLHSNHPRWATDPASTVSSLGTPGRTHSPSVTRAISPLFKTLVRLWFRDYAKALKWGRSAQALRTWKRTNTRDERERLQIHWNEWGRLKPHSFWVCSRLKRSVPVCTPIHLRSAETQKRTLRDEKWFQQVTLTLSKMARTLIVTLRQNCRRRWEPSLHYANAATRILLSDPIDHFSQMSSVGFRREITLIFGINFHV